MCANRLRYGRRHGDGRALALYRDHRGDFAECLHLAHDFPVLFDASVCYTITDFALEMALKSTIFRAELSVADIDRGYYGDHTLTLARHPSETDERMMIRLLAFALHADDALAFGRGLSNDDEPDLVRRDLTGAVEQWIDVGLPDDREVRKACGRAQEVCILAYGGRAVELWWSRARDTLEQQDRLEVREVPLAASRALAALAARSMRLQVTIQEGHVLIADGETTVAVDLRVLKASSRRH